MAIDRIGKGGPVAPPPAPAETNPAAKTERAFEVGPGKLEASHAVGQVAPTALERLRSGHLDLNGYLDVKVEEATAHLKGLSPSELESIQKTLRAQLVSDPALADLVKQATGAPIPPPTEE